MSETATAIDPNATVSHEVDGRVLTGVGVSTDSLAETMDRHTEPEPETSEPAAEPQKTAQQARDDAGKFAKQSRGQRRFDELTREREEARREATEAKRERDELRARLSAPPVERPSEPVAPPPRPAEPSQSTATRSKPTEDEIGVKYQSYGDFVEDLADWKAEQRLAALDLDAHVRRSIEADRASRSFDDHLGKVFTHARQSYQDFDAVLSSGPGAQVDLGVPRTNWLVNRPDASHVLYAIAKDGALAQRLASMTDIDFGIAVSQIASTSQPAASPASASVGSPVVPAPYQPVGSGSKTASIPSSALPSKAGFDFDKSGYREKRAQELGRRR